MAVLVKPSMALGSSGEGVVKYMCLFELRVQHAHSTWPICGCEAQVVDAKDSEVKRDWLMLSRHEGSCGW